MKTILSCIITLLFLPNFTTAQAVKIQYLANEGVFIESANTELLIDAAFKQEFDYLDVLPDTELAKIEKAEAPYKAIDIILATHVLHGDHFNAQITGSHMLRNTKTVF